MDHCNVLRADRHWRKEDLAILDGCSHACLAMWRYEQNSERYTNIFDGFSGTKNSLEFKCRAHTTS